MRQITIINQSTLFNDDNLVPSLQSQIDYDFFPIWQIGAQLKADKADPKVSVKPPSNTECIFLLDNSDQADALGYHELLTSGEPIGFAFVKDTLDAGDAVSGTVSHELLEQLLDPIACIAVESTLSSAFGKHNAGHDGFVAYEVADPVENDTKGSNNKLYQINNFPMSNFVFPSWFSGVKSDKYDFLGNLKAPMTMTPGGYISFLLLKKGSGWSSVNDRGEARQLKPRFTRMHRRHKRVRIKH